MKYYSKWETKGNQKIAVFDQDKETYEYVIYPRMYISKILENEK